MRKWGLAWSKFRTLTSCFGGESTFSARVKATCIPELLQLYAWHMLVRNAVHALGQPVHPAKWATMPQNQPEKPNT